MLYFPELDPWVAWSASLPAVRPGLSVRECGPAGSASARTACTVCPTLRQSRSRHGHVSPLRPSAHLRPSYQSGCMFLFYLLGVRLPCRSVFCQFWLWEEAQCVYLCRHLGSPYCLIFHCPLESLVSDLHIFWNTVGCLLHSSDQQGFSLVPGEVDSSPTYLAAIFHMVQCVLINTTLS